MESTKACKLIKQRVCYFFDDKRHGRWSVHDAVRDLRQFGEVAVIGGMLRDLLLFGNRGFKSDVDLVIDVKDQEKFLSYVKKNNAEVNKFGGYSMKHGKWQVDVWLLQNTWAHVSGHVDVRDFYDLTKITFFDCDAILFDFSDMNFVFKEGYFDKLNNKIIDVNLLPNPNPFGNAIRAFKYAWKKDMKWGRRLSRFMFDIISENGWEDLVRREQSSKHTSYMKHFKERELICALEVALQNDSETFDPNNYSESRQLNLNF